MKVVLFCGGLGLRIRDAENVPKPMVLIGHRPILWHLMKYYDFFGHKDFILCLGHGAESVKNYFLTADRTLSRKAREILLAVKIDQQQTKDQILENYLNTIYYGRGAYGIQTASKAYFNKDVSKLTPAESAFLAAVIRGPSLYDPALGEKQEANAKERSGFILDAMVEKGWAALLNWVLMARSAPGRMSADERGKALVRIMLSMPAAVDMSKAKPSMAAPFGSPKFIMGLPMCMLCCCCGCECGVCCCCCCCEGWRL